MFTRLLKKTARTCLRYNDTIIIIGAWEWPVKLLQCGQWWREAAIDHCNVGLPLRRSRESLKWPPPTGEGTCTLEAPPAAKTNNHDYPTLICYLAFSYYHIGVSIVYIVLNGIDYTIRDVKHLAIRNGSCYLFITITSVVTSHCLAASGFGVADTDPVYWHNPVYFLRMQPLPSPKIDLTSKYILEQTTQTGTLGAFPTKIR